MIQGIYINELSDIYNNYKLKYNENKHLLKDLSPKTIQKFMQNFMEFSYLNQIKNSITFDNFMDFVNSFYEEFFPTTVGLNDNSFDFSLKEKEEYLYLKLFFFENCLIVYKMAKIYHPDKYAELLHHLFSLFIKNFDLQFILINLRIFNLYLKNIILLTLKALESNLEITVLFDSLNVLSANENKRRMITLLFLNKLLGVDKDHGNFELETKQVQFVKDSLSNNIESFVEFLLDIKKLLHLILPNTNNNQLIQIQNSLQLLFHKFVKKIKNEKYSNIHNTFIEIFITKLNESKMKESEYENFVFLFSHIFEDVFSSKENSEDPNRLKILKIILQSNQPILHKLSVNILERIKKEKIIDNVFLNKFISVFDVLDGYNSHLFKGLWKDLENVIIHCENFTEKVFIKNKLFVKSQNILSIKEIFSIPFNYFLIIANKIKNHENARIQKFFIKSFANLCIQSNLHNKNFEYFLYSTLLKMLNNPLFYPENESISYHAKVGLIAEKLYSNWLERSIGNNLEDNLINYLKGIVNYIKSRRIFNYLMNPIHIVFSKNTSLKYNFNKDISENILKIIENNMRYLSFYQKQKCWETIDFLFSNSDLVNKEEFKDYDSIVKIFNALFKFLLLKDNLNYMSIENIDLLDNSKFSKLITLFSYFKKLFSKLFTFEKIPSHIDDFSKIISLFKEFNKNVVDFDSLNVDIVYTLFWFILINHENENLKEIFKHFAASIGKIHSGYISESFKLSVLHNLKIILNILEFCFNNSLIDYFYIDVMSDSYSSIMEYYFNILSTLNISFSKEFYICEEFNFLVNNSNLIEEVFQQFFSIYLKECHKSHSYSLLHKLINQFLSVKDAINKIKNKEEELLIPNLNENTLKFLHFAISFIKIISMKMNMIIHFKNGIFVEIFKRKENFSALNQTIILISKLMNKIEDLLTIDKTTWQKDNNLKNIHNIMTFNVIKIRTLVLMLLKEVEDFYKEDPIVKDSVKLIFRNDHHSYSYTLLEYLEKSNEEDIYYILKLISLYIYFFCVNLQVNEIEDDFFKTFIKLGFNTLIEKRENLNFINTITFLGSFINIQVVNKFKPIIELIRSTFNKLYDLNEKRTWLVLKIGSDFLFNMLKENSELIFDLNENIVDLAESKETRGEDSFMLQTNPQYLFSPFNVSSLSIVKNDILNEDIYKYGLYIRLRTMIFFDNYIKSLSNYDDKSVLPILNIIQYLLKEIDGNTAQKAEMQFTTKHRRKLRLSQLLLIVSQIFKINLEENKEHLQEIENLVMKIFEKVNLYSVKFYFDLFCLQLAKYKLSFINYLIRVLSDPNSKTHIVTSSLIILSILILEHKQDEYSCLTKELIQKIYETITALCTSNVCNIRGFAQYFIFRLRKKLNEDKTHLSLLERINISEYFYEYLINNTNIQRFFIKFNENYYRYTKLVNECNVENIITNNFDEVNCEIMPADFIKEFKEMAVHMVELENEDLTKPHISWKVEADKNTLDNKNIQDSSNNDFQKKYRPLEEEFSTKQKRKRLDVVVMASLIDKAPNLGGLARTCEVFNMGAMTINSDTYLNDNAFLTAAASAERWLPIISLPTVDIEKFIRGYKKLGYKIIGLEQTANSITLKEFEFEEKCLIVLGNEKEGIPQNLIQLIDFCVVIPQFGEIRSLNVHVSAALMLWELVNNVKNIK